MKSAMGNVNYGNDECYTTEAQAEYVINKYYCWLKNKKIILPCDCEWSELYKACKRHNFNCDIAQDMYGVDYSKYDICFTNPPFHKFCDYVRFLNSKNVKFLLFAPWTVIKQCILYNIAYYLEVIAGSELTKFKTPCNNYIAVKWSLITNLDEGKEIVEAKPDIRIEASNEYQLYRGIWSDMTKCNYLKYDYADFNAKGRLKVRLKQNEDQWVNLW